MTKNTKPKKRVPEKFLTPETLFLRIPLCAETIRRACRSGRIKAKKFGRTWGIPIEEVERIEREGLPAEEAA